MKLFEEKEKPNIFKSDDEEDVSDYIKRINNEVEQNLALGDTLKSGSYFDKSQAKESRNSQA